MDRGVEAVADRHGRGRARRDPGQRRVRQPQIGKGGRRLVVRGPARRIAEEDAGGKGVEHGRGAVDRRRILPLKFIVLRLAGEIEGVLQRDLFIQRVRRGDHLELAAVQRRHHLEHRERHRLVHRRKGLAIADAHDDVAGPAARSVQRVGIHRRVVIDHGGHGRAEHGLRGVGPRGRRRRAHIDDVGPALARVFHKGFHLRLEAIDGRIPRALLEVAAIGEPFEGRHIVRAEDIDEQVVIAQGLLLELPLKHESPELAQRGIEVEALDEVRRQAGEVGFPLQRVGGDAGGQARQRGRGQKRGLGPGGIEQLNALERARRVARDGLLVDHFGTGLAADRRQAILRVRQGLPDEELRGRRRPQGLKDDGQGLARQRIVRGHFAQIRDHRTQHGLVGELGKPEARLRRVKIPHGEGRRRGPRVHAAVHPRRALAVEPGEFAVHRRRIVELRRRQAGERGRIDRRGRHFVVRDAFSGLGRGKDPLGGRGKIRFPIGVHRGARRERRRLHGQRQNGQRHRGLQDLARHRLVAENNAVERLLAQDLEDRHGRAFIRLRVVNQHVLVRRGGEEVEVVAQRPRAAVDHQGVLLVGVVTGQRGVVLRVDGAFRLQRRQVAGARIARQHDLLGGRRPRQRVPLHHRGPVGGGERRPHRGIFFVPPHLQGVFARQGVDPDDGALLGVVEAHDEGIEVGLGIERRAIGHRADIADQGIRARRRENALAHRGRLQRGIGGSRGIELRIHPLKPNVIAVRVADQRAAHRGGRRHRRGKTEVLRDGRMRPGRIVLIHEHRAVGRIEHHRGRGAGIKGTRINGIARAIGRP